MQKVIAKAWMDEDFKQKLLAEPAEALQEEGIEAPPEVEIKVIENTDKLFHLVLPVAPVDVSIENVDEKLVASVYLGWW